MQWAGICEFVAVAELESFTAASSRLNVSTAQVSRQINQLEQRLNIKLFYRTTRRVTLTEEGRLYYQHCRAVLDALDTAEQAVTNLQQTPKGKVRLTAPVTYGEQKILPLVNDFAGLFPDIEVQAYLSNRQVDLLSEGYDLAIRLGKLGDSSMMAKKLGSRIHYLCAAPAYLKKYGMPYTISELQRHNCLLGTRDEWRLQEEGKDKGIRVKGSIRYNSGLALLDAALKGIGIVQLPDYYVLPHMASGELIELMPAFQQSEEGIWAVYPHNRHLSPKIRLLVEHLQSKLTA